MMTTSQHWQRLLINIALVYHLYSGCHGKHGTLIDLDLDAICFILRIGLKGKWRHDTLRSEKHISVLQ